MEPELCQLYRHTFVPYSQTACHLIQPFCAQLICLPDMQTNRPRHVRRVYERAAASISVALTATTWAALCVSVM